MPSIDNMHLGLWHVPPIGFRLRGVKRELILTPDHQKARLVLPHPSLPFGVAGYVVSVIVEQVALNIGLAGLAKKPKLIGPEIRVIALSVGIVADMARPGRRE